LIVPTSEVRAAVEVLIDERPRRNAQRDFRDAGDGRHKEQLDAARVRRAAESGRDTSGIPSLNAHSVDVELKHVLG
jgi:hypothetical protein